MKNTRPQLCGFCGPYRFIQGIHNKGDVNAHHLRQAAASGRVLVDHLRHRHRRRAQDLDGGARGLNLKAQFES